MDKEDLQKAYLDLEKEGFPSGKRIKFAADLGSSQEIAYHYELICKDWNEGRNLHLEGSFDRHGRDGLEFLFNQLDEFKDEKQSVLTAYLIAEILSKSKHRDFYSSFCDRLIPILISLLDLKNPIFRQKVVIALGWVGTEKEIDLLTRQMLDDGDALCRAWAATSLMQLSFHRVKIETICKEAKASFIQAITEEKDPYACGLMIEAAQLLFGKRWIPSSAVENMDLEKIEKAQKSAIRFLSKH
ncbi:HEAT repeat domain-containing protein [Streptococcus sp. 5905]|uniref:HEAT repeat domain-containing protein n=1 Tax=Streptococcus sp. 5905 TaxID=2582683 RepID=UPI001564F917|nr:HEAT repeat domain-containing protein [Streptococcus sp. 5905]